MSLVGNLEDLGLGEILQIVSLSRKSGVLRLNSRGRLGEIAFRQGKVIRASSSSFQESLGELLIRKGLIDLATLRGALALQEREGFQERLGLILIRQYGVAAAAIDEVVREQFEKVVYSLFAWVEGTFDFELQENVEAVDNIRMDPMQFMLDQGLNPQFLAMEGARLIDEQRHRGVLPPAVAPHAAVPPLAGMEDPPDSGQTRSQPDAAAKAEEPVSLVLVDDDDLTRETLAAALEQGGYRVYQQERSEDALIRIDSLYRKGKRPVVLADLIMPRMDGTGILGGLELVELVRNNFPDLRLLVMSDYHNSDAERRIGALGYPHIIKPRRARMGDFREADRFCRDLLDVLWRLRAGELAVATGDMVNLGHELRLELGDDLNGEVEAVEPSTGITLLRGMLEELSNPALGGGVTLMVLRFAAEFMNRAIIFMVRRDEIVGLGQFGIEETGGVADARVRRLRIPRNGESPFSAIIEAKHPAVVRPEPAAWNRYLFEHLGQEIPDEVFVGPIVSEGRVVAILYGDNLPDKKPIGGTEALEIFLSQAGVAMEKALLERKLLESVQGGT
ncbi:MULTISPECIES: response regulator [Geobacter]|uniref:response regulator n=1 Tax=Geobacter TaxID=28231 RepID=UPI0025737AB9|nr:response regulator [Geobacter sulfurreducens]BEH09792.1 response regulator [Geobacter sulfurreducens subsp. ethanolicus]BET57687.1 response regulator [Geobacter sp. 60473]